MSYVDQRIEAFLKKFARDTRRGGERALAPARRALEQLKHTTDYELKEEVGILLCFFLCINLVFSM